MLYENYRFGLPLSIFYRCFIKSILIKLISYGSEYSEYPLYTTGLSVTI